MISQAELNDIDHHLTVANDDERVAITIATETLRSLYLDLLRYREARQTVMKEFRSGGWEMISDEKLRALVEITATDVEEDEFASSSMRSTLVYKLCTELLARREAERAIWENAPDWANWYARDSDGIEFYYSEEPELGTDCWIEGGRNQPMREWDWQSTKQERPK